ncbi:MAG: sigma 54-interacting transcriptional regulator [Proteobacteria bacterium]|nr:sigma 54-interacting transcriptional regulator [Pseudomonadota bacterium]
MNTGKILFICTDNAVRSQMAEGFARKIAPQGIDVFSAGIAPAAEIHPLVFQVMKAAGVDLKENQPKKISDLYPCRFDLAVTLCNDARKNCPVLDGAPAVVDWGVADPLSTKPLPVDLEKEFQTCARTVENLVSDLFHRGYFYAFSRQKKNFDLVLNSLPEGIIAHDLNRRIFFFSNGASRLTGVSPEDAVGKDCHEIFAPHLCGKECSFCNKTNLVNFDEEKRTITHRDREGIRKDFQMTIVPMTSEDGVVKGVIASLRDRTEEKKLKRILGEENSFAGIIGRDYKMLQVFELIQDVSQYEAPVHISGETGTGKELVARAIHNESPRSDGSFVPINCGALPEGLIESELFGHVKGAFTGAVRDKKGRFELAEGGTIFLDEVADLPKNVQVKLLRFLQEGTLEKVGSEKSMHINARVISATNKDLKKEVQNDNFRDDLFYRINVIPICLPPLREKKNDIPLLVEYFLRLVEKRYGKKKYTISEDAMDVMMDYRWPGNVRELENALQFAIVKCRDNNIQVKNLPMELIEGFETRSRRGPSRKLDVDTVISVLEKTGGNKAKAAKLIGVGRATLYRFISEHPEVVPEI